MMEGGMRVFERLGRRNMGDEIMGND
jgi:hypothetical protein